MGKLICAAALALMALGASALAQPPSAGNVVWIPVEKYPALAAASHIEGLSEVMIAQDANGVVTDCKLIHTSGNLALDEAGCPLMTGASVPLPLEFNGRLQMYWHVPSRPSVNREGGAMPLSPNWWIVGEDYSSVPELRNGRRGTVEVSYDIDEHGHATNCQGQSTDGGQRLATEICALFERRAKFVTAVGASGPMVTKGKRLLTFR